MKTQKVFLIFAALNLASGAETLAQPAQYLTVGKQIRVTSPRSRVVHVYATIIILNSDFLIVRNNETSEIIKSRLLI
jgi:hypothetical protein